MRQFIKSFAVIVMIGAAGCSTMFFSVERSSRFVDENNNYILVDYGSERHTTTVIARNGPVPFTSNSKIRVEMPDGERFVAYHTMSPAGVLHISTDGEWKCIQEGVACVVARRLKDQSGYEKLFEGVLCEQIIPKKDKKGRNASIPATNTTRSSGAAKVIQ